MKRPGRLPLPLLLLLAFPLSVSAGCGAGDATRLAPDPGQDQGQDPGQEQGQDVGSDSGPGPDGIAAVEVGEDGSAHPDGGTEDAIEDASADTPADAVDGPDVASAPLRVLGAASRDGRTIAVLFDRDVDPISAGQTGAYTLQGSDNTTLAVASVSVAGRRADLTLAPSATLPVGVTTTCFVASVQAADGGALDPAADSAGVKGTAHLAFVWNMTQPDLRVGAADGLSAPWVRKYATLDDYDMVAGLADHPGVHVTFNLTWQLLDQLDLYVERLLPYVDRPADTVDAAGFLAAWKGRTDPFLDLLLEDTPAPGDATAAQRDLLYAGTYSAFSTPAAVMKRWPQYEALRLKGGEALTQDDFRLLKCLFELAWFDERFLEGPVALPTGVTVDLSDVVERHADGTWHLVVPATEALANRLVAEEAEVIEAIVPAYRARLRDPATGAGQIEVTASPAHMPILPLIADSDVAALASPGDSLPAPPFVAPADADALVRSGLADLTARLGAAPAGFWSPDAALSDDVVGLLAGAGIRWTVSVEDVLAKSVPAGQAAWYPYRVGDGGDALTVVFRNTPLSNAIGFTYASLPAEEAAADFLGRVLDDAPPYGGEDRLTVVLLDGECAWCNYADDGRAFLAATYGGLEAACASGAIVTVTVQEYLDGNPARGVAAHPLSAQRALETIAPGSWIDASFALWIGEAEENAAWDCLRDARQALADSGVARPDPIAPEPAESDTPERRAWAAWDALYRAESGDFFWYYGDDIVSPGGDDSPWDTAFRGHLARMAEHANAALALDGKPPATFPACAPIVASPARDRARPSPR